MLAIRFGEMKNVCRDSLVVSCLVAARVWSAEKPVLEKALWLNVPKTLAERSSALLQRCYQSQLGAGCWVLAAEKGMPSSEETSKEIELKVMTKWDLLKRCTVVSG